MSSMEFCEDAASTPAERGNPCTPGVSPEGQSDLIDSAMSETGDNDNDNGADSEVTFTENSGNGTPIPVSFYGLNYNTRKGPDWAADRERCKSRAEVVQDLMLLSRVTTRIRLLSLVDCDQGSLVWSVLSDELSGVSMEVWLGLWVGPEPQSFIDDYDALAKILPGIIGTENWRSRLTGISVGSEAIYREDVTVGEAIANLDTTRSLLQTYSLGDVPVAIVDIAPVYSNSRELRLASDTIMTNTFPFWEGMSIDAAVDELDIDLSWLVGLDESLGKPFVLSEHGWPSGGFLDDVGLASPSNQQQYLAESYCYLQRKGWAYYLFTAIDNDWRQLQDPNNSIEGNWGFLTADLRLKDHFVGFEFTCPHDGKTYSFAGIDWTVPELTSEETDDPANAFCGLWQGCEALGGDCCPTLNGDYLGCCRSENFLGDSDSDGDSDSNVAASVAPVDDSGPSCTFCDGQKFTTGPTINFSSGNDSVSCGGLVDLIRSGLSVDYCETEREFIEEACCIPLPAPTTSPPTRSPTGSPTRSPTELPTELPTRSPTELPTKSPTEPPTKSPTEPPTKSPTGPPTKSPTGPPTAPPTSSPTGSPITTDPTNSPITPTGNDVSEADEDKEDEAFSGIFPWDDIDGALPPPSSNTGASNANSSGNSNGISCRVGIYTRTTLLIGAMLWSAFAGWA